MNAPIVQQTVITPQLTTAASMLIRIGHPANSSLARALEKAQERLITQPWRIDAGILRIVSFSRQNEAHRTDGDFCECETRRGVCWHRAAWRILSTLAAAGIEPIADLPLPSVLDDDELPGDFLDSINDDAFDADGDIRPVHVPLPAPAWTPARELTPAPGSEFARAQDAADQLYAA